MSPSGRTGLRRRDGPFPSARWSGPAVLAALLALVLLSLAGQGPPDPRPADAPADRFSAGRAMEHVRALAGGPRSVGTPANARGRRLLIEELRELGLEPEVQERRLMWRRGRMVGTAVARNVAARVEGEASTGAVAMVAHHDTRVRTPGAADDASGVAAILEALRALRPELPLQNDLIVLFTDAEEPGLLGARAFAGGHRWMDDVAAVVNLEARGSSGASLMFETGRDPAWAVERLAGAGVRPVTSSLFDEVYRRLPNDTDFTIFRRAGRAGLNFAFIGGSEAYHMPLDTPERLSPASLQHHGEAALSLARELGETDLGAVSGGGTPDGPGAGRPGETGPASPRAGAAGRARGGASGGFGGRSPATGGSGAASPVFFSLPVAGLVRYPPWAALLLAGGLAVGLVVLVGLGRSSRRVAGRGIVAGLVAAPALVALGAGGAWLLREAALHVHPEDGWFVARRLYREGGYLVASVAGSAAVVFGGLGVLRRWFSAPSLAVGAVIWPVFFAVGASLQAVPASYLLAWPAAAGLGLAAMTLREPAAPPGGGGGGRGGEGSTAGAEPRARAGHGPGDAVTDAADVAADERADEARGGGRSPWPRAAAAVALSVPVAALAAPSLREFMAALGLGTLPRLTAAAGLFLLCLSPLVDVLGRPNRWWGPALCAAAAAAVAGSTLARAARGPAGPAPAPLLHVQEGGGGPAFWATARDTGLDWLDGFVPASFAELSAPGPDPGSRAAPGRASARPPAAAGNGRRGPAGEAPTAGGDGRSGETGRILELGSALYGPGEPRRYRAAPAPPVEAAPAELEVVGRGRDGAGGDGRSVRLRLSVPGPRRLAGAVVAVEVKPPPRSPWRLASVDGRPVPEGGAAEVSDGEAPWIYRHLGRPEGAVTLELRRPGEGGARGGGTAGDRAAGGGRPEGDDGPGDGGATAVRTALYLEGLPGVPVGPSPERPPDLMGSPIVQGRRVLTDLTVVRDTVRF